MLCVKFTFKQGITKILDITDCYRSHGLKVEGNRPIACYIFDDGEGQFDKELLRDYIHKYAARSLQPCHQKDIFYSSRIATMLNV